MFRQLDDSAPERVEIRIDETRLEVPAGVSVAAAMLLAAQLPTRYSAISGAARAPFCLMGICFECLVNIDGAGAQRACQVEVRAGMRIRRHTGHNTASGEVA